MPMSYKEAVAYAKELDVKLVPYENEHGMSGTKAAMEQIEKGESVAVFIGPEEDLRWKRLKWSEMKCS